MAMQAAGFQKVVLCDISHNFNMELEGLSRFFFDPDGGQMAGLLKKLQADGRKAICKEAHQVRRRMDFQGLKQCRTIPCNNDQPI